MSATQMTGEILFGGVGGQANTDPDFTYDGTLQTLYVENLTAGNLVFSGEALVSPTFTGTIGLGSTSADTVAVPGTLTFTTAPTLGTNTKLLFRDSGLFIYSASDGKLTISSDGVGTDDITISGTLTVADATIFSSAVTHNSTITVGVDGTGYDVLFYSATSGKSFLWDESADTMIVTATSSFQGIVNVGVDDTGYDVTFFGATTGKSFLWDESADTAIITGTLTVTGNSGLTGTLTVTSASASAFTVGRLGATTPALKVNAATGSCITGVEITAAATGDGVAVAAIGGTNESISIKGKGTGAVILGQSTSTSVQLLVDQPLTDSNGNELFKFSATASAVNELTVANGATTGTVSVTVTGSDTAVCALAIAGKAGGAATVAGGAIAITSGAGNTTGAGGAISVTAGAGGNDAVGGAASLVAGAAGGGNRAGGAVAVTGGLGKGTAAGGAITITTGASSNGTAVSPGASGALTLTVGAAGTATTGTAGAGGAIAITGVAGGASTGASSTAGAGSSVTVTAGAGGASSGGGDTGGAGGNVILTSGAAGSGATAGLAGGIFLRGPLFKKITNTTMTDTATVSAAAILGGTSVCTPTAAATYTLPTGTVLQNALPGAFTTNGDSVDWTVTNVATDASYDITVAGDTGTTLKGNATIASNDAVGTVSFGTFRFIRTGSNAFDVIRIA